MPDTPQIIDALYASVATEPDGSEGLCGASMMLQGREMFVPLVGADRARVVSYRPYAEMTRAASGLPIRLLRFTRREELETLK
jgi:hypothetical protein